MIDDVYTRGMYFLRVHVKAPVDLYWYHSKARTLLIFYIYITCNKSTKHSPIQHKNRVHMSLSAHLWKCLVQLHI